MKLTGAEILIECLKEQGVDTVFGFPGGAVLNIYDALYTRGKGIKHILTSHEQGASHAADGYARASGKVGVCIATSGPGATNLVTGIATAYMDSVPMVAITGQVATSLLGKDSFQEVDITGITMPITKHNYIVKDISMLAVAVRRAFKLAAEGRPGPVLVDVCKDVTAAKYEYVPFKPEVKELSGGSVREVGIKTVSDIINNAQKPVVISGGGVGIGGACGELMQLCEKALIPVACTLMGLGTFPGVHSLYTGGVGMHGTRASNDAVSEADLLIAVGTRFSDRVISDVSRFAPNAKIVHIDIDSAEVNKNVRVDYSLVGNIKAILAQITEKVEKKNTRPWADMILSRKEQFPLKYTTDGLRPQYVIEKLYELTKGDALITTEVGQNQLWAAQFYKYSFFRQYISSGGLGTMGYGLGACIGAKLARPERKVINVAGDGSFRMNCTELATAVHYKIPIVVLILNNGVLGMVRQWQELFYDGRYSQTTIERGTDFVKLAEAFGAKGMRITSKEQVESVLTEALSSLDTPVLIDCVIDKDDKVFPIVPPGKPIFELIEE